MTLRVASELKFLPASRAELPPHIELLQPGVQLTGIELLSLGRTPLR